MLARKRLRDKTKNFFCDTVNCASVTEKEPRPGTSKSIKSQDSIGSSEDIEKLKLTIERLRNENNALKAEIEKLKEITDGESEAGLWIKLCTYFLLIHTWCGKSMFEVFEGGSEFIVVWNVKHYWMD